MAHNGLELSCPAARATVGAFSRNLAGKSRSNFPHASRVSCSELFGGSTGTSMSPMLQRFLRFIRSG